MKQKRISEFEEHMTLDEKMNEIEHAVRTKAKMMGVWDNGVTYHRILAKDVTLDGLWLEFGVYRGRSITTFAAETSQTVYGFDSFEGLPEEWDAQNPQGCFNLNGEIPSGAIAGSNDENPGMFDSSPTRVTQPWPKNVVLVKGYFDNTLPKFLKEHLQQAAFVHVDSDIYSSCRTVLTCLKDRIVPGTIIAFDEIMDYPDYRKHELKAFAEFLIDTGYAFEALYYHNLGSYTQACFRILSGTKIENSDTTSVENQVNAVYPSHLVGDSKETFSDGHVGGCNIYGDPATELPKTWAYLIQTLNIKSIIDVGCGFGFHSKYFKDILNCEVLGIEGSKKVVDLSLLPENVIWHDYTLGPYVPTKTYDLCWSIEFVEHVSQEFVQNFVETFKQCRFIALTHATPGQGGYHHVNEQPKEYWIDLLAKNGIILDNDLTQKCRWIAEEDSADFVKWRKNSQKSYRGPASEAWKDRNTNNLEFWFSKNGLIFRNTMKG